MYFLMLLELPIAGHLSPISRYRPFFLVFYKHTSLLKKCRFIAHFLWLLNVVYFRRVAETIFLREMNLVEFRTAAHKK